MTFHNFSSLDQWLMKNVKVADSSLNNILVVW